MNEKSIQDHDRVVKNSGSKEATTELKAALLVPVFALPVVTRALYAASCDSILERHSSI